jgi:hypothetical protein
MHLYDTDFFKRSRVWRADFLEKLLTEPAPYWHDYQYDLEQHIDKAYVLYLPHREDKKSLLTKRLKQIKTKESNLLDLITWWEGYFNKTEWDPKIHHANYSLKYVWNIEPTPEVIYNIGKGETVIIDDLDKINITASLPESNIALGHASILQDIVDNNIQHALILEDDALFSPGFSWLMERMFKQLPDDWDIFYVSHQPCMYGFKSEPYTEDIVKITSGVWWLSGVFISQKAAKKLIDNFPIIGPIDVWINYHFDDLNVYGTMYNCINQDSTSSSDNTNSFRKAIDDLKNNL